MRLNNGNAKSWDQGKIKDKNDFQANLQAFVRKKRAPSFILSTV